MNAAAGTASSLAWRWEDARLLHYRRCLSWGWTPFEATWAAYYGKPFRAVLVKDA